MNLIVIGQIRNFVGQEGTNKSEHKKEQAETNQELKPETSTESPKTPKPETSNTP